MSKKFDVEKFLSFDLGSYFDTNKCIKCAVRYALGIDVPAGYVAYSNLCRLSRVFKYFNTTNLFVEHVSLEFAQDMDEAEFMLIRGRSIEKIKKFVIDSAFKHGLIAQEAYEKINA